MIFIGIAIAFVFQSLVYPTNAFLTHQLDHQIQKHAQYTELNLEAPSATSSSVVASEVAEKKTFKRFFQLEIWRDPELESLYPILCSIENSCRDINRLMRRISTDDLEGYNVKGGDASVNIQGESQKKLDVVANRILKTSLCCTGKVDMVASEEEDAPCLCSEVTHNAAFSGGDYVAVFDPLDGSSNIDTGLPTGTIFGVYRRPKYGPNIGNAAVTQRGSNLLVAGYCLYSAATHLVITMRTGLHVFTLDDITGDFFLTRSHVRIPRTGPVYSVNDANSLDWHPAVSNFLSDLKTGRLPHENALLPSDTGKKPSARYMGALVADAHNILMNGGIFAYPGSMLKPQGKLRLVYEANPLALVLEEADGMASDGTRRILDLPVTALHQRTPLFLGSADLVSSLQDYIRFYNR